MTHDASFQDIDEHKARVELGSGAELNFVDSYKYNIAAYRLAELLGIDDMLPVYVERTWLGNPGSLGWWLPVKMNDGERHKQKLAMTHAQRELDEILVHCSLGSTGCEAVNNSAKIPPPGSGSIWRRLVRIGASFDSLTVCTLPEPQSLDLNHRLPTFESFATGELVVLAWSF